MLSIIGCFDCQVGLVAQGGEGQRWQRALMDFAYQTITFDMKQLVEVLQCDLQVTINEGLVETQMELLDTIGGFVDHFQSEMTILSPHRYMLSLTRCSGSQALLDAIRRGKTSTQPESFL